jgi:LytTr DNA-binding domain
MHPLSTGLRALALALVVNALPLSLALAGNGGSRSSKPSKPAAPVDPERQAITAAVEWEARLPAQSFARVHRTAIVNLDAVEAVQRISEQAFHVTLRGLAEPVPLSRRHAARLRSFG